MCVSLRYEPVLEGVDVVASLKLAWYKQFMEGTDCSSIIEGSAFLSASFL